MHTMDIRAKILQIAKDRKKFRTSDIAKDLKLSRVYISSILSKLYSQGKLMRSGGGQYVFYALPSNADSLRDIIKRRLENKDLKEHEVLDRLKIETPFLKQLKENVDSIFNYAFSEMLNNAIEHSQSEQIEVEVEVLDDRLRFVVRDYGIGVFKNVQAKRNLKSELEAIQELLKGKTTTQPHSHSGEGIFFTSKVGDLFVLDSYNLSLRIDNVLNDVFVEEIKNLRGTRVTFEIMLKSNRHLNDVFGEYQSDPGSYAFDKTEILIKIYTIGTIYVSRSQARRIVNNLDRFKTVILDFDQVSTIGQAFADEIFRVFPSKHPEIKLIAVNINEAVEFMIGRVEKPSNVTVNR